MKTLPEFPACLSFQPAWPALWNWTQDCHVIFYLNFQSASLPYRFGLWQSPKSNEPVPLINNQYLSLSLPPRSVSLENLDQSSYLLNGCSVSVFVFWVQPLGCIFQVRVVFGFHGE